MSFSVPLSSISSGILCWSSKMLFTDTVVHLVLLGESLSPSMSCPPEPEGDSEWALTLRMPPVGRQGGWFKWQSNYSLNWEVMAVHGLHGTAQAKQIKDKRKTYLCFEADTRPEESSSLWTAVSLIRPKCPLPVNPPGWMEQKWALRCVIYGLWFIWFLYCRQWNVPHSMAGRSLIGGNPFPHNKRANSMYQ